MAGLNKMFKNFKNEQVILGLVGLVVLLFALYKYSENKNLFKAGMTGTRAPLSPAPVNQANSGMQVTGASANPNAYAPFNGAANANVATSASSSASMNKPVANPADLLPSDSNSSWASMNPVGDLKNVNLLNPTQVVGINTQGSSLRNANLQLRSEPANPQMKVSPWLQTTIEPDVNRRALEIGA